MNIFIIPSWFPNAVAPMRGVFFREQAEAIAHLCPKISVIVSTWGHDAAEFPIRKPWCAHRWISHYLLSGRDVWRLHNGVHEIFNPALSWSHRLPGGGSSRLLASNRRNLENTIRKFGRVDLIHAFVAYPAGYLAMQLAEDYGIPYVLSEVMGPFPFPAHMDRNGMPRREILSAFSCSSASTAISPSLASTIASFGLRRPRVIPFSVDERRFFPEEPSEVKFTFLTLSVISEEKGIDTLLYAIAAWNPSPQLVQFWIGGEGPRKGHYQKLAVSLDISDRVHWLGSVNRENVPALFRRCHAFVMPSRNDTFGVVYAEAIASGKPIIATRCGGPESIVNRLNGLLTEVGDVSELALAMGKMQREWSHYDAQAIRVDFEDRFSRPAVVKQFSNLYEEIIAK